MTVGRDSPELQPWRKVLYIQQPYADNYVGDEFLEELKRNVHVTLCTRTEAVCGAAALLQQSASVALVALAFIELSCGGLRPEPLLASIAASSAAGYGWLCWAAGRRRLAADLRLAVVFCVFGYGLSPLLATLTDSVSTDSVYALAAAALVVHLGSHEYGPRAAVVSPAISLNAGLFGALCLASRLPSTIHVFAFLTASGQLLALLPPLRPHVLRRGGSRTLLVLSVCEAAVSLLLLWRLSGTAALLLCGVFVLACPLLPVLYVSVQRYKDNIYGPWDEAVVEATRRTIRRDDELRERRDSERD